MVLLMVLFAMFSLFFIIDLFCMSGMSGLKGLNVCQFSREVESKELFANERAPLKGTEFFDNAFAREH